MSALKNGDCAFDCIYEGRHPACESHNKEIKMATKLDRQFVIATLDNVRSLANEVERLECYVSELEARLSPAQIQDASKYAAEKWGAMERIELE